MDAIKNHGLKMLEMSDWQLEQAKEMNLDNYREKEHSEIKLAIFLIKKELMLNRIVIEVDCTEEELENIVQSQYITLNGKTWSVLHEEVIALQINKGKGKLTITEVQFQEEEPNLKKV